MYGVLIWWHKIKKKTRFSLSLLHWIVFIDYFCFFIALVHCDCCWNANAQLPIFASFCCCCCYFLLFSFVNKTGCYFDLYRHKNEWKYRNNSTEFRSATIDSFVVYITHFHTLITHSNHSIEFLFEFSTLFYDYFLCSFITCSLCTHSLWT